MRYERKSKSKPYDTNKILLLILPRSSISCVNRTFNWSPVGACYVERLIALGTTHNIKYNLLVISNTAFQLSWVILRYGSLQNNEFKCKFDRKAGFILIFNNVGMELALFKVAFQWNRN